MSPSSMLLTDSMKYPAYVAFTLSATSGRQQVDSLLIATVIPFKFAFVNTTLQQPSSQDVKESNKAILFQ